MNDSDLCLEVVSRSRQPVRYIRRWISRKPLEIEAWFQRTTSRKWHMDYRVVMWPMTSRDPYRYCEAVRSAILATAWLLVYLLWTMSGCMCVRGRCCVRRKWSCSCVAIHLSMCVNCVELPSTMDTPQTTTLSGACITLFVFVNVLCSKEDFVWLQRLFNNPSTPTVAIMCSCIASCTRPG